MNVRSSAAAVICLAALFAQATETEIKDNIEIPAEGKTIDVASGDTKTYSGVLSGSGKITKTGAGTLVLSGANTFSGGISWAAGVVRVDREGALGTGTVTVQYGADGLVFNAEGATFGNYFVKGDGSTLFFHFKKSATITGNVLSEWACDPVVTVDEGAVATFEGQVKGRVGSSLVASRGWVVGTVLGSIVFKGNLLMPVMHDTAAGRKGTIELWNAGNAFDGNGIDFGGLDYVCHAANVLNNAILNQHANNDPDRYIASELDLGGFDQQIRSFTYSRNEWSDAKCGTITSASPATLTVTGSGADQTAGCNFEINGAVSLVLNASPTYRLQMLHRISKTTGSITVESGILEIGGSSTTFKNVPAIAVGEQGALEVTTSGSGALSGLDSLSVADGGSFTVADSVPSPFTADQIAVALGSSASLTLPANMSLKVVSFTLDGEQQPAGEYTSANCSAIKSGKLVVPGTTVPATWVGGGADEKISTKANWTSERPFGPGDTLEATFAASGTRVIVDELVKFAGITLTAPEFEFAAAEGGKMSVDAGIVVSAIAGSPLRRFDFAAPLAFTADQTIEVPAGSTVTFSGIDSPTTVKLTKSGAGTLVFDGVNSFSGSLTVTEGTNVISGLLTTPNGVVEVNPASTITMSDGLSFGGETKKKLLLQGATIDKPLLFGGPQNNYSALTVAAGTTNRLRSALLNANLSNQGFYIGDDAVLISEGGVQQVTPWRVTGRGAWHIRNKPIRWYSSNKDKWLVFDASQDNAEKTLSLVVETTGNLHNFQFDGGDQDHNNGYGGTLDCRANDAFAAESQLKMSARWAAHTYLLLHSTTQRFDTVNIMFQGDLPSDYQYGRCEIRGDAGAALGVRGSGDSQIGAPIVGNVSILKSGTGTLTMKNRAFASTGDIVVSGGTLAFAEKGAETDLETPSWLNGTNAVVKGTGRLELSTTAVFNRKFAQLHLADDGVIAIPSGTTAKFKHVTVDGVEIQPGAYTYATAPADLKKHMTADSGTLVSKGDGLILIVR